MFSRTSLGSRTPKWCTLPGIPFPISVRLDRQWFWIQETLWPRSAPASSHPLPRLSQDPEDERPCGTVQSRDPGWVRWFPHGRPYDARSLQPQADVLPCVVQHRARALCFRKQTFSGTIPLIITSQSIAARVQKWVALYKRCSVNLQGWHCG